MADEILNGKITKNEIYFALRKVKKGKTAGIDGFPVERQKLFYAFFGNFI